VYWKPHNEQFKVYWKLRQFGFTDNQSESKLNKTGEVHFSKNQNWKSLNCWNWENLPLTSTSSRHESTSPVFRMVDPWFQKLISWANSCLKLVLFGENQLWNTLTYCRKIMGRPAGFLVPGWLLRKFLIVKHKVQTASRRVHRCRSQSIRQGSFPTGELERSPFGRLHGVPSYSGEHIQCLNAMPILYGKLKLGSWFFLMVFTLPRRRGIDWEKRISHSFIFFFFKKSSA
jgi:hypothetical protein